MLKIACETCIALFFLVLISLVLPKAYGASVTRHDQTASGLQGWVIREGAIEIQLNPLTQDQVRGFYLGRGFSNDIANDIAKRCVYQGIVRNISSEGNRANLFVDLTAWRVSDLRGKAKLKDKRDWMDHWKAQGADDTALLAFRWATLPSQQNFDQSGDYGWGMIVFGDRTVENFSVMTEWQHNNEIKQQWVKDLYCPQA